jgi:PAS domain S-box-containing protein
MAKILAASTNEHPPLVGHREAADWFFENCIDLLVVIEREIITRINPAWTDLTGWTNEETVGRPFLDFVHRDDRPAIADMGRQLAMTGVGLGEHRALEKRRAALGPLALQAGPRRRRHGGAPGHH